MIGHIFEAIKKIEKYIKIVKDFDEFSKNDLVLDATVRELEIIGEAANNIGKKFQKENPDVPWRQMIGIRNALIHEYFGVNKKIVWETCKHDLKKLKSIVRVFLK